MPFNEGSSKEDLSAPSEYDLEQARLKEERLAKEAEEMRKNPKEATEKNLNEWVEEKKFLEKQKKIQEKYGVKKPEEEEREKAA